MMCIQEKKMEFIVMVSCERLRGSNDIGFTFKLAKDHSNGIIYMWDLDRFESYIILFYGEVICWCGWSLGSSVGEISDVLEYS